MGRDVAERKLAGLAELRDVLVQHRLSDRYRAGTRAFSSSSQLSTTALVHHTETRPSFLLSRTLSLLPDADVSGS